MKRYLTLAALVLATNAHAVSVGIDPAQLIFTPAEKATFCGTSVPSCPTPPPPAPPPPPSTNPPPGDTSCANSLVEFPWQSGVRINIAMRPDDIVVATFTTGGVITENSIPNIQGAEIGGSGPPSTRLAALSDKPCDFTEINGWFSRGNSFTIPFGIGKNPFPVFYPSLPVLKPNTKYYLSIRNEPNTSCRAAGVCDIFVFLNKPGGL